MTRTRGIAVLCALVPWFSGCAATIATSGSLRLEHARSGTASPTTEIRVAPVATVRTSRRPSAVSMEIAPLLTLGGTSEARLRLRAAARWEGEGMVHPSFKVSMDEGHARATELAGDTIAPVPAVALVRLQAVRAGAGIRFEREGRLRLDARVDGEHSGGVGASASVLPQLSAVRLDAAARYTLSRRLAFDATSRVSSERTGDAAALEVVRVTGSVSARTSPSSAVFARAGGAHIVGGATLPGLELGASYAPHASALRVAVTAARGPEVDRLDGLLRNKLRTRVHVETPVVPGVSFGGTLQSSADIGGLTQRVVRNADANFSIDLARGKRLNIGVARFEQYSGGSTTNRETRAVMQLTFALQR